MEISAYTLLLYATIWTIFYWFLSQYIAELSRQKWTKWVESEESDDTLMNALAVIVDEIEDRMHDKLESFQASFFGSLGAASKKLDDATGASTIKAVTKDNPIQGQNPPQNSSEKSLDSGKLGLK
jgi:hypothetical protein